MTTHRTSRFARRAAAALAMAAIFGGAALGSGRDASAQSSTRTFVVTSVEDKEDNDIGDGKCSNKGLFDTKCSLRAAIQEANATPGSIGVTIVMEPNAVYLLDREGRSEDLAATGDLDIRRNMRIRANTNSVGVTAKVRGITGWDDRIFHVHAGTLDLEFVSVERGNPTNAAGGGLRVEQNGNADLFQVDFRNNKATGGGAIFAVAAPSAGTILTMSGGVVADNQALSASGGAINIARHLTAGGTRFERNTAFADGGAIVATSTTILNDVDLLNNRATNTTTANDGGALANQGTLVLKNSRVIDNQALNGAGLVNRAGGNATVEDTRFESNFAGDGTGAVNGVAGAANGVGGAIRNQGTLTLTRSVLHDNAARFGGAVDNSGTLTVKNSVISANNATTSGGGIRSLGTANLNNNTIVGNGAVTSGGGLRNEGGAGITLRNSILANNSSASGADCAGTINNGGFNLVKSTTGCIISLTANDLTGVDPLLSNSQSPQVGSPVIDRAHPSTPGSFIGTCEVNDLRSSPRPKDGNSDGVSRCDMGAIETSDPNEPIP